MVKLRKMSKIYYLRQIVACLLVYCILLAVPAQVAMADSTPAPGVGPSTGAGGYTATLGGTATTAANTTTITAPNGSVFDWQNFDIGSGHTVQHPSMGATDAVLHRINVTAGWGDGDATGINGNLSSPGYLFVVNPMGIVMGADALISANRFVASGLDISNFSDFISGSTNELQFEGYDTSTLGVELQAGGQISANAVALIGKTVVNDGTINSDSVVLAAGERVYLAVTDDSGKLAVDVTDLLTTVPADNKVTNTGTINATDGNVLLAAGDIYSLAISGVEDLAAVSNENIELDTGNGDFGADNIVLTGDFDDSGTGNIDINTGITLNGGTFTSEGVDFDNTGGIITTNDGKVDIQNTGNVTIGADINAGAGDVDIDGGTDVAASIIDGGGTITSSGAINLEASGDIGVSGAAIDTAATGTINATSTVAGDIYIDNTGAVSLGTVSTTASDIVINNAGNLTVDSLEAGGAGDVSLTTTNSGYVSVNNVKAIGDQITIDSAGAIAENGNDSAADLTADTLDLTANDGIGDFLYIETAANTITARTIDNTQGGANIWLSNDNASPTSLTASTVSDNSWVAFKQKGGGELTLTDVSTVNGGINVEADSGDIVAAQVNKSGIYGSVYLTTINSGDITVGSVTASGNLTNLIDIDSAGAIDNDAAPDGAANAVGGVIDLTADSGGIGQSTTLEVTATTELNAVTTADGSNIDIDSIGDFPVGLVDAGAGDVTLDSSGNIMGVTDDETADVAGSTINLIAAVGGIGDALDVTAATALNADTTADGSNIDIDSIGDLPVGLVDAGTGDVTLNSTGNIMGVAYDGTADVVGSTINLTASVGGIGNALEVTASTELNADTTADGSNIDIDSIGDLPVGLVDAAGGDVTLNSDSAINDASDDTDVDIIANMLTLSAVDEIGGSPIAGTATDTLGAIETTVTGLDATSTTAGDIVIVETDDVDLYDVIATSGSIYLEATLGGMTHVGGTIEAGSSTLTLVQQNDLDLAGFTFANQENTDLMVEITDGGFTTVDTANGGNDDNAADQWQSIQALAKNNIVLQGSDADEDIKIGTHAGFEPVSHPFGGVVDSSEGGVSIISDNHTVRTAGDTILDNVVITGTSDDELNIGVDLPYGPGKAAIVVMGAEDLMLGENVELTASGTYDTTGDVDDREGLGLLDVRTEIPEGFPRYEGDAFDAAIYLASTDGDVDVSAAVSIMSSKIEDTLPVIVPEGAMVIDAYDTVTFDESGILGGAFEDSLENGDVGDRLEVVSRITEWLFQAVDHLPYPSYPYNGAGPFPADYTYVLRGAGLDNAAITDGRAWVLVDPDNAPLDREAGEKAQMQTLGLDGCPILIAVVSAELGIPEENIEVSLANSYALNTDVQPCESCARLIDAAAILADEDGSAMAAMNQVFNSLAPANAPYTPEMAASIASAFAGHINDGSQYATVIEYIDAFVNYIAVLNSDLGSPVGDSLAYTMQKYGSGITGSDNANMAAFVASRLETGETFGQ